MLEYKPRKLGSNPCNGNILVFFQYGLQQRFSVLNFQKEGEVLPPSPVIFYYAPYNSVIYFAQ